MGFGFASLALVSGTRPPEKGLPVWSPKHHRRLVQKPKFNALEFLAAFWVFSDAEKILVAVDDINPA